MAGDWKTGVTLQTLDTKKFDRGLVLDQTGPFDIPYPCDMAELLSLASERGAQMLADGIRSRVFVPPLMELPVQKLRHAPRHAGKIQTEDRHPDWSTWSADKILRYKAAVGPLWNTALVGDTSTSTKSSQRKRVILTNMKAVDLKSLKRRFDVESEPDLLHPAGMPPPYVGPESDELPLPKVEPGLPFTDETLDLALNHKPYLPFRSARDAEEWYRMPLYVFASDGTLMRIDTLKVEGEKEAPARRAALKAKLLPATAMEESHCEFYGPLQ